MNKQILMVLLLSSLFCTSNPIGSNFQKTKDCLKVLVPLNLFTGLLGYLYVITAEGEFKTIAKVEKDPIKHIGVVRDFATNYKKTISLVDSDGKRSTGSVEDNSLALALITAGKSESKLKEVILYINNIMRDETTARYYAGYVIPVLSAAFSLNYVYDKFKN